MTSSEVICSDVSGVLTLLETIPDAAYFVDREGSIRFANTLANNLPPVLGQVAAALSPNSAQAPQDIQLYSVDGANLLPDESPLYRTLRNKASVRDFDVIASTWGEVPVHALVNSAPFSLDEMTDGALLIVRHAVSSPSGRELMQRNATLKTLNKLAAGLLHLDSTEAVYAAALNGLLEIVGTGKGAITAVDFEMQEARVVAHRGFSQASIDLVQRLPLDAPSALNTAHREGQVVVLHPDSAPAISRQILTMENTLTGVHIPVRGELGVSTILTYVLGEYRDPTPIELEILRTAANYVGAALERVRLTEQVNVRYSQMATLIGNMDVALAMFDHAGRYVLANNAWLAYDVHTRDEVMGKRLSELPRAAEAHMAADRALRQAVEAGEPMERRESAAHIVDAQTGETQQERYVDWSLQPVRNEAGGVSAVLAVMIDVTGRVASRRQAEAHLKEIEENRAVLHTIFEGAPVGIALYDLSLDLQTRNAEWEALLGEKGDILPTLEEESNARFEAWRTLKEMLCKGEDVDMADIAYIKPETGEECFFDLHMRPIKSPDGKTTNILGAIVDVTERHKLESKKDEFVAMASHELKTPITAIKGFAQLGSRQSAKLGDKQLERTMSIIDEQANRVTRLINEMLDVSRLQNRSLELFLETFDLTDLLREVVGNMALTAPEFTLALETGPEPLTVTADRQRIDQVITNLVSNAVKYSADKPLVEISARNEGGYVQVDVRDYGVGIPADQQGQVFDRFFRAGNVMSQKYTGLGLGLFISHGIVERHKGRIWLDSQEGEGSTFHFALPRAAE